VIARRAGTTSSTGDSGVRTTIGDASSGSQRSTGSSRPSRPSSTSSIVAAAVIGLLFDAIRKIVSRVIGVPPPNAVEPMASTRTSSPRATSVTIPGNSPRSTRAAMASCNVMTDTMPGTPDKKMPAPLGSPATSTGSPEVSDPGSSVRV
jgi:hypothetical protein